MTRDEILEILGRFQKHNAAEFGIRRLGVFGSIARGAFTETSDVDVVVELTRSDLFALVGIKQELEKLLNRRVDIVRYRADMNPRLKGRIDKDAVYV